MKLPLPPGNMSTLFKNDDLFEAVYFKKFPVSLLKYLSSLYFPNFNCIPLKGFYDTMDAGYKDENGYVYVTSRDDDIINVAGHRISTSSLEDAVLHRKKYSRICIAK